MDKKPNILIRWRWLITAGAVGDIFATVHHYRMHDVMGWPVPSALVLPLLTVGGVGIYALTVMVWAACLHKRPAPQSPSDGC